MPTEILDSLDWSLFVWTSLSVAAAVLLDGATVAVPFIDPFAGAGAASAGFGFDLLEDGALLDATGLGIASFVAEEDGCVGFDVVVLAAPFAFVGICNLVTRLVDGGCCCWRFLAGITNFAPLLDFGLTGVTSGVAGEENPYDKLLRLTGVVNEAGAVLAVLALVLAETLRLPADCDCMFCDDGPRLLLLPSLAFLLLFLVLVLVLVSLLSSSACMESKLNNPAAPEKLEVMLGDDTVEAAAAACSWAFLARSANDDPHML